MASRAPAQSLQSYCYSNPSNLNLIEGVNIDKKYPIASVSKLVTSYWALSKKGPDYQYLSVVHLTPVGQDQFDLHLQGSRDPYFGREKIHFMISELNKKGITRIRNFSFDQNFLYLKDLDIERDPLKEKGAFPWQNYFLSPVGPRRTLSELQSGLMDGYVQTVQRMARAKINLVPNARFSVGKFEFKKSSDFTTASVTRSFSLRSAPLYRLLKEMNRNSNNFAAVMIFDALGSASDFAQFIKNELGLGRDAIEFFEGSGNRVADAPVYNSASCRALLLIIRALSEVARKKMLDIDDVVSVMGEDGLVADGFPYTNDLNDKAGVAKTGTTAAAITLGGMLNTQPHRTFFMYNVNPTSFTAQKRRESRNLIGQHVKALTKKFADSLVQLDYKKVLFTSFDDSSFSEIPAPRAPLR